MSSFEIDDHSRTIIHIDIDCFYAQVEMNKNPNLRSQPLGVQQKFIVVTANYKAREFGIKKCMSISDARNLCPNLVLVNGEDLYDYRQVSYKITNLLHKYTPLVERLGLDENFMDVTTLVDERLKQTPDLCIVGNTFGNSSERCECGCTERLTMGTVIAQEVRDLIKSEFNLTTCGGVAHNKLLAKIAGSRHKPDQQTVVFPNSSLELMLSLSSLTKIPGIGRAMFEQLENAGIGTIEDLQNANLKNLETILGLDKAKTAYDLSYGIDKSAVKPSGKPQSIGLEDSCRNIFGVVEARKKLEELLKRLLLLVSEDGRAPKTIKLTLRRQEKDSKISHRETKQCNISPSIFISNQTNKEAKIMTTVMHLFGRIIDTKKPFHLTLVGLCFTKFQESPSEKNSIASFLHKDIDSQSSANIKKQTEIENIDSHTPSTSGIVATQEIPNCSPQKAKLENKKRSFEDHEHYESLLKSKITDLCSGSVPCPPDVDKDVFNELPRDVQKELWDEYKMKKSSDMFCGRQVKKAKPNTLLNYFIRNK